MRWPVEPSPEIILYQFRQSHNIFCLARSRAEWLGLHIRAACICGWRPRKKWSLIDQNRSMAKTGRSAEDRRLTRVSKICLGLPEATRRDSGGHAAFLVRKKTFAYFLNDHHGDGIVSIACKALPGENAVLAAAQPTRFYLPSSFGQRIHAA